MRIAYLGQMADVSRETSIAKKIRSQSLAWISACHTVRYFALTSSRVAWPGLAPLETDLLPAGGALGRLLRAPALCRRIRAWQPDLIYFRYAYHAPGLPALFRDFPTVAEINSDDQREYPLTLGRLQNLYHRFTRHRVLNPVRGFVPVTRELAQRFVSFGQPSLVVANSIDLGAFPALAPADISAPVRLAFLGSPGTPWHGLDRLGELAALLPDTTIDIIGCARSEWASASAPPPNVIFHGHLTRDRYQPLLQQATAALGTFGLYRKGMHEACPLKVREYLALGLPVITAYKDTDIPPDAPYCLRLPNNSESLAPHRDVVSAFIARWRTKRVPRAAVAHLDTSAKEAQRLDFMRQLMAAR